MVGFGSWMRFNMSSGDIGNIAAGIVGFTVTIGFCVEYYFRRCQGKKIHGRAETDWQGQAANAVFHADCYERALQ